MRPNVIDVDLENVDDNGLAASQSPGAAALTLNGALISGGSFTSADGIGRNIVITSGGNDTGITFAIVGTDQDGKAQTENLTGASAGAALSSNYFKTVASITPSGAVASTVYAGTSAATRTASSKTYPIDWASNHACNIHVDVTGTINFTVQETFVDILGGGTAIWSNITALASKTADTTSTASVGATAIRVIIASYNDTAELQMYTSQPLRGGV